eukprot:CAMPEP_0172646200 /NCGR_PEP_ID=MMETSP1068-20121228/240118_1 /TAXON_ID=35684 /ORGANISM="Pseudopedinella elastica, Strain CCMP716" /LENGTH=563 /DNA_ID=CAMNT_0013460453 /DNA_START=279 /DNA_END=1970 /DNA_ORIENTATION=+
MSAPRVLTGAALLLFLGGNFLAMRQPSSAPPPAQGGGPAGGPGAAGSPPAWAASSGAVARQLQSELATTNALLDRPVAAWTVGGGAASALEKELSAQKAALSARFEALEGTLEDIKTKASRLAAAAATAAAAKAEAEEAKPRAARAATAEAVVRSKTFSREAAPPPPPVAPAAFAAAGRRPQEVSALGADSPVLMICFSRADYLRRALAAVKKFHPANLALSPGSLSSSSSSSLGSDRPPVGPPVVVSQDGEDGRVASVIGDFKVSMLRDLPTASKVVHLKHSQRGIGGDGYHKLAQHYGWALGQVFEQLHVSHGHPVAAQRVLLLEEDLEIAPDFFDYFAATAPLLDDPKEKLLCVSAWNDNGQGPHVSDPRAVYRSSFFPGLGWMMNRALWTELGPRWPRAYWDDWLREPPQQAGREVLRPEVCRTYHFAKKGVSNNQYSDFLTTIKLNDELVSWRARDLSFLRRAEYDPAFRREVAGAPLVGVDEARQGRWPQGLKPDQPVRVEYPSVARFEAVARRLGIMDNVKAGVPRVAYHGVVTVRLGPDRRKVHVSPPISALKLA